MAAQQWRVTFDALSDAVWLQDADHRIQHCNKAALHFFKKEYGDVVGRRCWEIVHGTTQPIPDCLVRRMQKSRRRECMELPLNHRWCMVAVDPVLSEAGEICGAVHVISDITEKREVQEALRQYRFRLAELVDERTAELTKANEPTHGRNGHAQAVRNKDGRAGFVPGAEPQPIVEVDT